jgi:hypothetical protein
MKAKYVTTGISFPDPELMARTKAEAKKRRWSFSSFVCWVLENYFSRHDADLITHSADGGSSDNHYKAKSLLFQKPTFALECLTAAAAGRDG